MLIKLETKREDNLFQYEFSFYSPRNGIQSIYWVLLSNLLDVEVQKHLGLNRVNYTLYPSYNILKV